MKALTCFVS